MRDMRQPKSQILGGLLKIAWPTDRLARGRRSDTWLLRLGPARKLAEETLRFLSMNARILASTAQPEHRDSTIVPCRSSRTWPISDSPGLARDRYGPPPQGRRPRRCPGDVEDRIQPATRPMQRFSQRSHVRVVVHRTGICVSDWAMGQTRNRTNPDLVRTTNLSCSPIDRPAKPTPMPSNADVARTSGNADSICRRIPTPPERGPPKTASAGGWFGIASQNKLEFRPANFDAEVIAIHGRSGTRSSHTAKS